MLRIIKEIYMYLKYLIILGAIFLFSCGGGGSSSGGEKLGENTGQITDQLQIVE
tara:strand:- start:1410 stop:1571 length:162 start_codon:yes stop_codon:yes gene_type:complete